MSKIQDLKGTHNFSKTWHKSVRVVSDVKDTRFERNSQHFANPISVSNVVSDVKDTRFERNSQPISDFSFQGKTGTFLLLFGLLCLHLRCMVRVRCLLHRLQSYGLRSKPNFFYFIR